MRKTATAILCFVMTAGLLLADVIPAMEEVVPESGPETETAEEIVSAEPEIELTEEVTAYGADPEDPPAYAEEESFRDEEELLSEVPEDVAVYEITYELNGPEDAGAWDSVRNDARNPLTYDGKKSVKLYKPQRSGFTFLGWYREASFRHKITKIKKGSRGDRSVYAKWKENRYTVVFKANGGKGKMKARKGRSATDLSLPSCKFTYAGHRFIGWSLKANPMGDALEYPLIEKPGEEDPSITIKENPVIEAGTYTSKNRKITLYAQWENIGAADYYVAETGDDANDGLSQEQPLATIQRAIDQAAAGSVIHVAAGTYKEMLTFGLSGEKTDPIVIKGPEDRSAKLTYTDDAESITLIDINGKSNIRIENLEIGDIEAKYACGIYLPQNSKNIAICNNKIHDIKVKSEYLVSPEEDEENAGEANAILCLGEGRTAARAISNIRIFKNEIFNNVTNWSESLSVAGNCSHVYVEENRVHDNTNIGIDFNGNTGYCPKKSLDQPRYCRARENTVYNCHCDYAECAGIYVDGARNTTIADNEVYECDYGIEVGAEEKREKYPVKKITVTGNHLHHNNCGGIRVGGYDAKSAGIVINTKFLNNKLEDNNLARGTLDPDPGIPEITISRCRGIRFGNNEIIRHSGGDLISTDMGKKYISKLTFRNNVYKTNVVPDQITFSLYGRQITGIRAFNKATGGRDLAEIIQ